MRTREIIEKSREGRTYAPNTTESLNLVVELLLDIRELLASSSK